MCDTCKEVPPSLNTFSAIRQIHVRKYMYAARHTRQCSCDLSHMKHYFLIKMSVRYQGRVKSHCHFLYLTVNCTAFGFVHVICVLYNKIYNCTCFSLQILLFLQTRQYDVACGRWHREGRAHPQPRLRHRLRERAWRSCSGPRDEVPWGRLYLGHLALNNICYDRGQAMYHCGRRFWYY